MVFYFGSHIPASDEFDITAQKINNVGGNLVQVMLTAKGNNKLSKKAEPSLNKFIDIIKKNDMKIIIHASYLINLARDFDYHSWWLKIFKLEIQQAYRIGAIAIVVHFGKQLDLTLNDAYENMIKSILYILKKTEQYNTVKILLETTAGQGSELCSKIEDLGYFYNKLLKRLGKYKKRIGICVDTCHIFAAGHDIRTKNLSVKYLNTFQTLIGLHHINLIHLNDSKCELGCRLDRHENIGEGKIGLRGLKLLFRYFKKINVPIVLETPNAGYSWEIELLNNNCLE